MTNTLMKSVVLGAFVALSVQGCRCGDVLPPRSTGEVRLLTTDATGAEIGGPDAVYDFGNVSMGKSETIKLRVSNVGLGTLTITRFDKESGDATVVGPFVTDANPVFNVNFAEATPVGSADLFETDITFTPTVEDGVQQHPYQVVLKMTSADVPEGLEVATITIKGNGVSGECDLPAEIDFGAVAIGDTFDYSFEYANQRPIDTRGYLGSIESAQGPVFTLSPDSPKGDFIIPAMRSKTAKFSFKPTENKQYLGSVLMRRADGCPERTVRLRGDGVAAVLSWSPMSLDFGYVTPNSKAEKEITFSNGSLRAITLSELLSKDSLNSGVFKITRTDSADLTKLVVPAASRDAATGMIVPGTVTAQLSFAPVTLGGRAGFLTGNTGLMSQPQISVPLKGVGGGPDIKVTPSPVMNFGRVAYFPGVTPASSGTRQLVVQNVGTRPTQPDPRANLKLGKVDANGDFVLPYFEVTAITGDASEICVGTFDTATSTCSNDLSAAIYNPAVGLEAGTSVLNLPVRIAPNGLGARSYELKIFSNDSDAPVTTVTINATSVEVTPCQIEVTPSVLAFGIVAPPTVKDLGFQIRNTLTGPNDLCLLSNLQLLPETGTPPGFQPVFSLPSDFSSSTNPINELELMPGETKQVIVRAWPQGQLPSAPANVVGKVQFNQAHPSDPVKEVTLTATIATSCLAISPSALDFGTVKKDCNSSNRAFNIYNSCSSEITINSAGLGSAAGEGAGGPNCPGNTSCPEFFVVSGIPGGTRISAGSTVPVTFSLKYRPINYGPDTGAFVINVTQNSQALDYVVALQGNGDMTGLNTDTFRQDSEPKADILIVMDVSGSMDNEQAAVGTNMDAFLQYARANRVDFQIGLTTSELSSNEPDTNRVAGELWPTGTGLKILKPGTPNLSSEFQNLVVFDTGFGDAQGGGDSLYGGSEGCLTPAVRALTGSYINDPTKNLGFLRNEAVLAIVCITDAQEQSPTQTGAPTMPVFLNLLLNIKGSQRASAFTYNVVGPFLTNPSSVTGCSYDGSPDDGKHAFMVQNTNGVKEEICTPNWAQSLERIGKNAFGYRTNFFLNSRPDLASSTGIVVQIDGVTIAATDPVFNSRVWQYNSTTNSIDFESLYVPEPGKTLTVTYTAACIP